MKFYLPKKQSERVRVLHITGYVQASEPMAPADDGMEWIPQADAITLLAAQYRPGALAMKVTGHSMDDGSERAIRHGDVVLVDPNLTFSVHHNNAATIYATQNGYIVKERGLFQGRHCLLSRNPNYGPIFEQAGFRMVGSVYARYEGTKQVKWLM